MTKTPNIVFLFSGQGSHYRGMGSELFFTDSTFREAVEFGDALVKKQIDRSLIYELYERKGKFDDLLITHPAIITIELAMLKLMKKINIQPDLVVGNSLGEFSAGVAAGVWTDDQAIVYSIKRAEAIVQHVTSGGMIAVLHERTPELTEKLSFFGLYLASDNFKGHFTASGLQENISRFKQYLDQQSISYLVLEVAWPFHSPYMEKVKDKYPDDMSEMPLHHPVKTKMYSPLQEKAITTAINPEYFWHAVSKPFNFGKMLSKIEEDYGPCLYIDLGPSGTMATFVKYNLSSESPSVAIPLLSPFKGVEKRLKELRIRVEN